MSNLSTEEEQIAALKKWWNDNGNSLLIGVGAALAVVFGWKAYQNSIIQEKTEASLKYQQLLTVATQTVSEEDAEEANTISYLAQELKDDHQDSEYAIFASLLIAKELVGKKEYDGALEQLSWVSANTQDSRIKHIVNGRMARILSVQGKYEDALSKLVATEDAFKANFLEISGDIKKRSGDKDGAVEDYKAAYLLVKEKPHVQPLLAVKLSDMGVNAETL